MLLESPCLSDAAPDDDDDAVCSLLPAGNTADLPSHEICHGPGTCRVVSSSSHSIISIFVPSLLLPGSNSKRARAFALLEDSPGDSTLSVGDLGEEVSGGTCVDNVAIVVDVI